MRNRFLNRPAEVSDLRSNLLTGLNLKGLTFVITPVRKDILSPENNPVGERC